MTSTTPKVITRSDPTRIVIEWSDGHRTTYSAAELRGLCPCAQCVHEVTGVRMHDPASVSSELTQRDARMVGHYALTMTFSDGHHTGIFTFEFLRRHDPADADRERVTMAGGEPLEVRPGLVIPGDELDVDFARSGGPGGQNVNKVESKVVLRWSVRDSRVLRDHERARLLEKLGSRLTTEGDLVLHAGKFRERARNLVDARERLAQTLDSALTLPKPRRKTKPTRGSDRRRLEGKRQRSDLKRGRRGDHE